MRARTSDRIRVVLPRAALSAIFDECDRYDQDETGGRIVGTYTAHKDQLTVTVSGVIGPGPNARRTAVSFFQDGEYQEDVFRGLENAHPKIEHLGNWHTHHVNGFPTLSPGDIETYRRTVNHESHNTDFFYALLVVAKNARQRSEERYSIKHYVLKRDDSDVYEVASRNVELTDSRLIFPTPEPEGPSAEGREAMSRSASSVRVYDRDILATFYPGIRPYSSPRIGLYWRGGLELVDGSRVEAVVIEDSSASEVASYSVDLRKTPESLSGIARDLAERQFSSARAALIATERECNRALYNQLIEREANTPGGG